MLLPGAKRREFAAGNSRRAAKGIPASPRRLTEEKGMIVETVSSLLRCPFCGAVPVTRQMKVRTCQLHGEPLQDWMIACPKGHAQRKASTRALAIEQWNERV